MRCLLFTDVDFAKAVDLYNKWAENKVLARDVIIHSHTQPKHPYDQGGLCILVFFDERIHTEWVGKSAGETEVHDTET